MTEQLLTQWETEARDPRYAGSPECVLMLVAEVRRLKKELSGWHAQMSSFEDGFAQKNRDIERLQTHAAELRAHYLEEQRALIEKTGEVERLEVWVAEMEAVTQGIAEFAHENPGIFSHILSMIKCLDDVLKKRQETQKEKASSG